MKLTPGQRLTADLRDAYDIVGPAFDTSTHEFWKARRPFWNYRDRDRSLYGTDQDESLDVLVRVAHASYRDDLDIEFGRVLGVPGAAWFLTPLDRVALGGGFACVFGDPHGRRLSLEETPVAERLRLSAEVKEMLEAFDEAGLVVDALDPGEFLIDTDGRWTFLGTHRVRPATSDADLSFLGPIWTSWARGFSVG
jgi:hypothetical protein